MADPDGLADLITNDPAVQQALEKGIAGGIPGLEPQGVSILGAEVDAATGGGRRLRAEGGRRLSGAVKVTFQLMLPEGSTFSASDLEGLLGAIVGSIVAELQAAAGITAEVAVTWNLDGPPGSMSQAEAAGAKASGSLFIVGLLSCCLLCGTVGCVKHCVHKHCGDHHKEGKDGEADCEEGSEMGEIVDKMKDPSAVMLDDACPSGDATATPFSTLPSVDCEHCPDEVAMPTLHLGGGVKRSPSFGDGWKAPARDESCDSPPPVVPEEFERQVPGERTPPVGFFSLGESPPPVPRDADHQVPRMTEWQAGDEPSSPPAAKARLVSLGEASPAFSADAAAEEELDRELTQSLEEARRQAAQARREALEVSSPRAERGIVALDDVRFDMDMDEQRSECSQDSEESIKPLPGLGFDWSQLPVVEGEESEEPAACRSASVMPLNVQVRPASPAAWGQCGPTGCIGSGGMAMATTQESQGPSI